MSPMTTLDLDQLDPDVRRQVEMIVSSGQQRRAAYRVRPATVEGRTAEKLGRLAHRDIEVTRQALKDTIGGRDAAAFDGTKGELLDAALTEAVSLGYICVTSDHPLRYGRGTVQPPE